MCLFLILISSLGPIETEPELARSLENHLSKDLEASEDSDSEEGDTLPYEWEAVSGFFNVNGKKRCKNNW